MEKSPIQSIYQWYYDVFLAANWGLDYNNIWFVSIYPQDGDLGKFFKAVGTEAARFDVKSTGVDAQGIVNGYNGTDMAKMVRTAWNYNVGKIPDNCNVVGWDFGGNVLLPVTNVRIPKDSINTQTVEMGAGYTWVPPILADKHQQFAPLILDMYYTAYPFGEFVVRPWSMAINRFGLKARQLRCNICCTLFTKNNHYLAKSYGNNWAPKFEYRFYSCYPLGVPDLNFKTDDEDLTKTTSISFGYDFYRISIPNGKYLNPVPNSSTDATTEEFTTALKKNDRTIPGRNYDDAIQDSRGNGTGIITLRKSKHPMGDKEGDVPIKTAVTVKPGKQEGNIKKGADDAINTIMGNGKPPVDWTYTTTPPGKGEGGIKKGADEPSAVTITEPFITFFDEPLIPLVILLPTDPMDDPIDAPTIEGRVGGDEPGGVSVSTERVRNDEPETVVSEDGARLLEDDPDRAEIEPGRADENDELVELLFEPNGPIIEDDPNDAQNDMVPVDEYDDPNDAKVEQVLPDTYDDPNDSQQEFIVVEKEDDPDEPTLDLDAQMVKPEEDEPPHPEFQLISMDPDTVAVRMNDTKERETDDPDKIPAPKRSKPSEDDPEKVKAKEVPVKEKDIKVKIKTPTVSDKDDLKELKFKTPKEIDNDEPKLEFLDETTIDNDVPNMQFGDSDTIIDDEPTMGEVIPDIVVFNDEPGAVGPDRDVLVTGDEPGMTQPVDDIIVVGDEPNYPSVDEVVPQGDEPSTAKMEEKPVEPAG